MKLSPIVCGLFVALWIAAEAAVAAPPLLPAPQRVEIGAGRLVLRDPLRIVVPAASPARVMEIAEVCRDELRATTGIGATIERGSNATPAGAVVLVLTPPAAGEAIESEAYTVKVAQGVEIAAADPRGLLWGVQTLLQMIDMSAGLPTLPQATISDRPARAWRAVMLDPVRSFLDLDFVRRTIRVMSAYKLNILHLHLIDDQAWRFETRTYPNCNRPGEPRYTQAELKELVTFAKRYGVEILPEFDFPGHVMAAVAAYPELDCEGEVRPMNEAILCPGKPTTWAFLEKVIAEAAEVFPFDYLHLGGDEPYAIKRWASCPHCQQRMQAKGVASLDAFYHTFVLDLNELAKRHGKKLIVWNDAVRPGVEPMPTKDIVIDAWTKYETVAPLAEAGYTMINSSQGPLYLTSFGLREGLPLPAVYQWSASKFASPSARRGDQTIRYKPLSDRAKILGGQACAWATEQRLTERRLYPRLLAVAETLWSEDRRGDLANLQARLDADHLRRLHKLGVPDDDALASESLFDGTDLKNWMPMGQARFRVADGAIVAPGAEDHGWLRSKQSYRDFILTFEQQAAKPNDFTGVYVRCAPESGKSEAPDGRPVPTVPPKGFVMSRALQALKGWNRFELVARGPLLTLTINGGLAWSVVDPAPRDGAIVLRGDGEGFQFRNLRLRNLEGK